MGARVPLPLAKKSQTIVLLAACSPTPDDLKPASLAESTPRSVFPSRTRLNLGCC